MAEPSADLPSEEPPSSTDSAGTASAAAAAASSVKLHPDDENLLEWKGSYGDTAAEALKKRRDNDRAAARLALLGKTPTKLQTKPKISVASSSKKKATTSRVLDETMQSWMKKTTYLSNDYTRKVHDFKSLAKTKEELVQDLALREKHSG